METEIVTDENDIGPFVTSDEEPWAMVPQWLIKSNVSGNAIRVWCGLYRYVTFGARSLECFPGKTRLQEDLDVAKSTLERGFAELQKVGALQITERWAANGDQISNLYHLTTRCPTRYKVPESPPRRSGRGARSVGLAHPASRVQTISIESDPKNHMSADSPLPAEAGQEEPHFLVPGNEMAKPSPSVNKDHSAPAMTSRVSPHQTSKSRRTEIDLGVRGGLKNKNGRRNVIDHDLDFMDALRWEYRDWAGLEETLVMAKVDHYYKLSADGQRLHVTRYAANGYKWWKEAQDKTKFTRISGAPIGAPAHQLPFLD